MKMNEIIKTKRKELKLTQEQVAEFLGVSTPAVNKWENEVTYPDITLLPALARLLKVDMNTLMSFDDDLTELEIANFTNELMEIMREKGYDVAFQIGMEKIQNYPTCDGLIYSISFMLEGCIMMFSVENSDHYREKLEKLYERLLKSDNEEIRNQATSMMISKHMNREDYKKAKELINNLPSPSIDKTEQEAKLYIRQEKFSEASELLEHKVFKAATDIQLSLMWMIDIALKENRQQDADYYADVYEQTARLYDTVEFTAYTAHLELATHRKEADKCLKLLHQMFSSLNKKGDINGSLLYRHMKKSGEEDTFNSMLLAPIINELKTEKELEFIRIHPGYESFLKQFDVEVNS